MGFLAQLILAARNNDDGGGWVQLLVFLVMAIFWIVGGIKKARANKVKLAGDEGGEEELERAVSPRQSYLLRRSCGTYRLVLLSPKRPAR